MAGQPHRPDMQGTTESATSRDILEAREGGTEPAARVLGDQLVAIGIVDRQRAARLRRP